MDYENYDEERYQAELDLIIAEKEEREARADLMDTINSVLKTNLITKIIIIVLLALTVLKLWNL